LNEYIQEPFKEMVTTKIIDFVDRPYFDEDIYFGV
jgi:hypothetical protein